MLDLLVLGQIPGTEVYITFEQTVLILLFLLLLRVHRNNQEPQVVQNSTKNS